MDGQQALLSDGDSNDDGVSLDGIINPFVNTPITITTSGAGLLDAWIDYNRDGDWDDPGEQIFTSQAVGDPNVVGPQETELFFQAPLGIELGTTTYARFRFSSVGGLLSTGLVRDGEVEDYLWPLTDGRPPIANDDPIFIGQYTTTEDLVLGPNGSRNLLSNDTDPDAGDVLSVVSTTPFVSDLGAAVSINSDGTFSYDPTAPCSLPITPDCHFQVLAPGETVVDTFTYTISDGNNGMDTAEVTVRVQGVNDAPIPMRTTC